MTWSKPTVLLGALIGVSCGLAAAGVLALVTPGRGEAAEGAALVTMALGAPVSLALATIPWLTYLSNWALLAFTALPLNGLLIGAVAGAGARAVRWDGPAWSLAVPALWAGIAVVVTLLASVT